MNDIKREELMPGVWRFEDTGNVYVIQDGDRAIAVDFGSGRWLEQLPELGISGIDHVLITHCHRDCCEGLGARDEWDFQIHAPAGSEPYLDADCGDPFGLPPWYNIGCPPNYLPPRSRLRGVKFDLAGNTHFFWRGRRIRVIDTSGHTAQAISVVADANGAQLVFCGDAVHAGATLYEPFHLEWDHWTGAGALAAWEGIQRLAGIAIDMLCPSHGPLIADKPHSALEQLSRRLMDFYRAKGQISPHEPDRWVAPEVLACGALRYSDHLYQFGQNGYLLISEVGNALIIDPYMPDMDVLNALLHTMPGLTPKVALVTHYHYDHCDAIDYLRARHDTSAWLHPLVIKALADPDETRLPWLKPEPLHADHTWRDSGTWDFHEYEFQYAPWPGQTWWHCVFMATIDGRKVMFGGDNFTPASKWNGTGGFCAYNGSRFDEGFIPSAQLALDWQPDIIAAGHGNCYEFAPAKFEKIIEWAGRAQEAVLALCPDGDIETHYYAVHEVIRGQ